MKRALVLALACVIGLGVMASAGPVIGINLVPAQGKWAEFSFGWEFQNWTAVINKPDFSTWTGEFSLLVAWIPNLGGYDLRIGPQLNMKLNTDGLQYKNLVVAIGVQKSWEMVNFFAQMEISSTHQLVPRFGFEIELVSPQTVSGQTE